MLAQAAQTGRGRPDVKAGSWRTCRPVFLWFQHSVLPLCSSTLGLGDAHRLPTDCAPRCHAPFAIPQLSAGQPLWLPLPRAACHLFAPPCFRGLVPHPASSLPASCYPRCYLEPRYVTLSPATIPGPQRTANPEFSELLGPPHDTRRGLWSMERVRGPRSPAALHSGGLAGLLCFFEPLVSLPPSAQQRLPSHFICVAQGFSIP